MGREYEVYALPWTEKFGIYPPDNLAQTPSVARSHNFFAETPLNSNINDNLSGFNLNSTNLTLF